MLIHAVCPTCKPQKNGLPQIRFGYDTVENTIIFGQKHMQYITFNPPQGTVVFRCERCQVPILRDINGTIEFWSFGMNQGQVVFEGQHWFYDEALGSAVKVGYSF